MITTARQEKSWRSRLSGTGDSKAATCVVFAVTALSLLLSGCRAVERVGDATRGVVAMGDPTGLAADAKARKQAADAIRDQVSLVDVETLNSALRTFSDAVDALAERIRTIQPDTLETAQAELQAAMSSLRKQIEAAELDRTSGAIADAGEAARAAVARLDVKALNALVARMDETLAGIAQTAEMVGKESEETLRSAQALISRATDSLDRLPVEAVRVSTERIREASLDAQRVVARLPDTTGHVESTLRSIRTGARIFSAVSVLIGGCALAWLVSFFRGRHE